MTARGSVVAASVWQFFGSGASAGAGFQSDFNVSGGPSGVLTTSYSSTARARTYSHFAVSPVVVVSTALFTPKVGAATPPTQAWIHAPNHSAIQPVLVVFASQFLAAGGKTSAATTTARARTYVRQAPQLVPVGTSGGLGRFR